MKPNELRIGNWVHNKYDELEEEVESVSDYLEEIHTFTLAGYPECFEPIPLTEEWLNKFGFDFRLKGYEKYQAGTNMSFYINEFFVFNPNRKTYVKIKHVHQLQNLYHALMGEELTTDQQ